MFKVIKIFSLTLVLFSLAQLSFAASVLSGGNTDNRYVVGANFVGGTFGFQLEVEGDIGINESFSIAPRIGGTGFGSIHSSSLSSNYSSNKGEIGVTEWAAFLIGVSARFGIIQGLRPHGFWIGPSMDIIFTKYHKIKIGGYDKKSLVIFTPSAEFGWRYTFDFGLSLQALIRLGFYFDTNTTIGLYGLGGIGIGYSF
jgi:hypothetical protein